MTREIVEEVRGFRTQDGAGVRLVRVLGHETTDRFDPFLMLDSFDSTDPDDYVRGFPLHPHRGIETVTYLAKGCITHRDSLGNHGSIGAGEAQWMTAGSGIMHEEMPQPADEMLGVQLWLNMPASEKMSSPAYNDIRDMPEVSEEGALVRIVGGSYRGTAGFQGKHVPADIFDIQLFPDADFVCETKPDHELFLFLIKGDVEVEGSRYAEKTALALGRGSEVRLRSVEGSGAEVILFSAPALSEPIAWGGPIVMNTQEELRRAFQELDDGTFVKEEAEL